VNAFERLFLWFGSVAAAVTGLALLWMKYFLPPSDPWSVINHPLQPWVLKLHILAAPLLVFGLGVIALRHVWEHMRQRVRRGYRSGIMAGIMALLMVPSGYLVQVITAEPWLEAVALGHIAAGTIYVAALLSHTVALLWKRANGNGGNASPERR
jgi:hypothetical protein